MPGVLRIAKGAKKAILSNTQAQKSAFGAVPFAPQAGLRSLLTTSVFKAQSA
jgi:hypothetical protein